MQFQRSSFILNICMVEQTRIAAVHFFALPVESRFPVALDEVGEGPSPRGGRPELRAVRADLRGRSVIVDVSRDARREGIRPGMTATEARARLPELELRDRDAEDERSLLEGAAELLLAYGPLVEVSPPSFAFVEIGRSGPALEKLLEAEPTEERIARHIVGVMRRAGHEVSVAIAKDPDTARTVAAHLTELRRQSLLGPPRELRVRGRASPKRVRATRERGAEPEVQRGHPPAGGSRPTSRSGRPAPEGPERGRGRGASPRGPSAGEREDRSAPQGAPPRTSQRKAAPEPAEREVRESASMPAVVVVPGARELAFLARLPIEALLWTDPLEDPDGQRRERLRAVNSSLRILGIHDVARMKTLPSAQLASRFGDAGALLVARAFARIDRPLRPFVPPDRIAESYEVEAPLEDLEPVLFVLRRLCSRIEARLEARALAASALSLTFAIEPNLETPIEAGAERPASSRRVVELPVSFARPTRKASVMIAIVREKLQGSLPGAVYGLSAEVKAPSADRGAQLELFSNHPKKLEEVGELVGRLEAALGSEAVFTPDIRDTHRPEAAWSRRPFEVERALEVAPVRRPRRPARALGYERTSASGTVPGDRVSEPRSTYMLPELEALSSVAQMPACTGQEGSVEEALEALALEKRAWPKAIQRKVEDEPLPLLPPRPLELFEPPIRATLGRGVGRAAPEGQRASSEAAPELRWRGERVPLRSVSGCERLEAEWWTPAPLAREYVIAESEDGRRFWLYYDAEGTLFVHGVFD